MTLFFKLYKKRYDLNIQSTKSRVLLQKIIFSTINYIFEPNIKVTLSMASLSVLITYLFWTKGSSLSALFLYVQCFIRPFDISHTACQRKPFSALFCPFCWWISSSSEPYFKSILARKLSGSLAFEIINHKTTFLLY